MRTVQVVAVQEREKGAADVDIKHYIFIVLDYIHWKLRYATSSHEIPSLVSEFLPMMTAIACCPHRRHLPPYFQTAIQSANG